MQTPDDHDETIHPSPPQSDEPSAAGLSRRSLMRSAAGVGAATVAAGFLASALAEPAMAQTASPTRNGSPVQQDPVAEPIVAHVRDARTGEVDLFVGTRHIRVHDTDLAARLARAAH